MKSQSSFGIVGLTRPELRIVQLLIHITRNFPDCKEQISSWLEHTADHLDQAQVSPIDFNQSGALKINI